MKKVEVIGLSGFPAVKKGDKIGDMIVRVLRKNKVELRPKDILVIAHKIVSKSEGNTRRLKDVKYSSFAERIGRETGKDPRFVQVVLDQSKKIVRIKNNHIIVETLHGFVCANAGVDRSNSSNPNEVVLLPENPDLSAKRIRERIKFLTGVDVAVIISDTHGRPFRRGVINVAVGISGLNPFRDYRGKKDFSGYVMRSTVVAVADEIACAAELVMGQGDEGVPVVIVRGLKPSLNGQDARQLVRTEREDIFR